MNLIQRLIETAQELRESEGPINEQMLADLLMEAVNELRTREPIQS